VASYDAKINVLLSGIRDLALLEDRIEKISGLINTLNKTPISLNVGGRGKERDLSGVLSKEVNDYVREWVNGNKEIGKSINAVRQQAAAFQELLRETAMIQQDSAAKVAVQNLAEAWADTTRAATEYDKKLNDIQRKALGLQPQAVRDFEVARRQTFVQNERRRRQTQAAAAQDVVNADAALLNTKTSWLRFFDDAVQVAQDLTTAARAAEGAASVAARERLAIGAKQREERAAFLAGSQISQFPIGPNPRSTRRRFENDVSPERAEGALRARELERQRQANQQLFAEEKMQIAQLDMARATAAKKQTERITALSKTIKGSLSSAAIGGAFPLLFGQSAEAAVGGAVGGLLGGAQGGFAGSLIGTALGEIAAKQNIVKELSADLGLAANQTAILATAFAQAGKNSEQFQAAVLQIQGLSIALQDQVSVLQLASRLTGEYGGSIEKVTKIYADFVSKGKVGITDLTKLTAQGIPIQQALADKYDISRTEVLQYAKDGKISVQDLSDTLFALGNTVDGTSGKAKTGFERFKDAVNDVATAVVSLARTLAEVLGPILDGILSKIAKGLRGLNQLLTNTVSRNLGLAGLAFTTGFESQGIDNLQASLKALSGVTPQSREELALLNNQLEDISTNLRRVGPESANRNLATSLQGQVLQQQKRLGAVKFEDTTGLIKPVTVPSNLPPDGAGSNKAANAQQREAKRLATLLLNQRALTAELKNQYDYNAKIFAAEMAKDPMLARRLQGEQQLVEWGIETAKLLDKEKTAAGQLAIAKAQQAKQGLIIQKTDQDLARLEEQRKENAQNTILGLKQELDLRNATTEAERNRLRIQYEMEALKRGKQYTTPELQQIEALKKQLAAPETAGEIIQKRIGALQDELIKLTNIGNIAVSVADSIGTAFSQAFQGIISGTMTAQEALASFFQSVGDAFIQMASEIIAKQITMIILQTILKALGGGGGGGGTSPFAGGPATGGETNTFAYAAGAPKFRADGGPTRAGTPYLVGERGPELFVPGTSGGVMSNSDLRSSMGAAPGSSGGPVLNMSFETSTINGVEYVSRDQLEAAMAQTRRQAARDGASRGMSMTLDRLQQSPSTRRKVGI
jgi:tape measure domain-containing protein